MQHWWSSLTAFQQVAWAITIPVTLIFALQTILTFAGVGGHHMMTDMHGDFDVSHDHGSFQLFNFRNFINFFLGFGWSIIALEGSISNQFLLITISFIIGILLVAIVMGIFYGMSRMAQSGNMDIHNAVGQIAEVYLSIPPARSGAGKIHVTIQGALRELDAMTAGERIATNQWVKVTNILDNQILLVEHIAHPQS